MNALKTEFKASLKRLHSAASRTASARVGFCSSVPPALRRVLAPPEAKVDAGFTELKTDIAGVRADIVSIKGDLSDLKSGAFKKIEKEDLLARVKYIEDDHGIESGM
jgi:hypothetical protein